MIILEWDLGGKYVIGVINDIWSEYLGSIHLSD
jgi:hypothetical protein